MRERGSVGQWFWSFLRPAHKAYQEAFRLHETFNAQARVDLLGPTVEQIERAKRDHSLGEARRLYCAALEKSQSDGVEFNVAAAEYQLGLIERLCGNWTEASKYFLDALERFESIVKSNPRARASVSLCHFYAAQALFRLGHASDARAHAEHARSIDWALDDTRRIAAIEQLLMPTRNLGRSSPPQAGTDGAED